MSTVKFNLARSGYAEVFLCSLLGETVKEVFSGYAEAGENSVVINTSSLSPGVYFVVMNAGSERAVEKLIVFE